MQTVLIIDDDPIILELMSAYLTLRGFRAVTAPDGRAGLEAFAAERPDAVLCDLTMPGLGGLGVLAEVKRRSVTQRGGERLRGMGGGGAESKRMKCDRVYRVRTPVPCANP